VAESAEQQDALFVNLVLIFQNAAMQQMGKITNPMTGKVERNLDQARFSIDVIDMLRSKTRGNLSSDLEKLLDSTLTNLRMNYVEEANKAAEEEAQPKEEEKPEGTEVGDSAGAEGASATGDGQEAGAGEESAAAGESAGAPGDAGKSGGEGEGKDASGA
jgi:hypothetical protein